MEHLEPWERVQRLEHWERVKIQGETEPCRM
jgi:hypothetical protein